MNLNLKSKKYQKILKLETELFNALRTQNGLVDYEKYSKLKDTYDVEIEKEINRTGFWS